MTSKSDDRWWLEEESRGIGGSYKPGSGSAWLKDLGFTSWARGSATDTAFTWSLPPVSASVRALKALRKLQRDANTMRNSKGEETKVTIQWAGKGAISNPKTKVLVLDPTKLLNTQERTTSEDAAMDALCGKALVGSALFGTMHPEAHKAWEKRRNKDDQAARNATKLWQACEQLLAKSEVLRRWPGLKNYLLAHQEETSERASLILRLRDAKRPTVELATSLIAHNLLYGRNKIPVPAEYKPAIRLAAKRLARKIDPAKRWAVCRRLSSDLVKLYKLVEEKKPPPPPEPGQEPAPPKEGDNVGGDFSPDVSELDEEGAADEDMFGETRVGSEYPELNDQDGTDTSRTSSLNIPYVDGINSTDNIPEVEEGPENYEGYIGE